jgi:hypothetical protein
MVEEYAQHGVRFQYPDSWELAEQPNDDGVAVTVSGLGTCFWMLQLFLDAPPPDHVISQAVDAFRDEYDEMDFYPVSDKLCDRPASGGDIEFVCLELINGASVRACQTDQFTVLVLFQGTDSELEETRETLEAITASLQCDSGDG